MHKSSFYLILLLSLLLDFRFSVVSTHYLGDKSSLRVNLGLRGFGQSKLETTQQAVRNGNLTASNIRLNYEQTKAIGWLKTKSKGRFCTATVISDRTVLTAKHCFYGRNAPSPDAVLSFAILDDQGVANQRQDPIGDPFLAEAEFPFVFGDIIPLNNLDIAMIRFAGQPFNRPGLQALPINVYPLEGSFKQNLIGAPVDVAGYGKTLHKNEAGRYFTSVKLELITATYIVTNGQNEQGICNGDSGGPLLASGVNGEVTVLGVVTNGDDCCVGLDQLTRVDIVAEELVNLGNAYSTRVGSYPEACRGISKDFQCRGNTLHFCLEDEGEAVSVDCASEQVCAFDNNDRRFDCVSKPELACPDISPRGVCIDDETLLRCEYGEERRISCVNTSCGLIPGGERFACISDIDAINTCNPDNQSRLEWASEVAFEASNTCANQSASPALLLLFLALLILVVKKRRDENSIVNM